MDASHLLTQGGIVQKASFRREDDASENEMKFKYGDMEISTKKRSTRKFYLRTGMGYLPMKGVGKRRSI